MLCNGLNTKNIPTAAVKSGETATIYTNYEYGNNEQIIQIIVDGTGEFKMSCISKPYVVRGQEFEELTVGRKVPITVTNITDEGEVITDIPCIEGKYTLHYGDLRILPAQSDGQSIHLTTATSEAITDARESGNARITRVESYFENLFEDHYFGEEKEPITIKYLAKSDSMGDCLIMYRLFITITAITDSQFYIAYLAKDV
jgi:hypothetical protein